MTPFSPPSRKDYFKAINLNGLIYSSTLGFDTSIAIDALEAGALASGLSGTGSAFFAIVDEESIDDVHESWQVYEGQIIKTKTDNVGCSLL